MAKGTSTCVPFARSPVRPDATALPGRIEDDAAHGAHRTVQNPSCRADHFAPAFGDDDGLVADQRLRFVNCMKSQED